MAEKKKGQTSKKAAAETNNGKKGKKAAAGGKGKEEQIQEMQDKRQRDKRIVDDIWGVVIFAIGTFLIISTQLNTTGEFGAAIHNVLRGLFGVMAYVLPYYFIVLAFCLFFKKMQHINFRTVFFSILIYLMFCLLNSYRFIDAKDLHFGFQDLIRYYRTGVEGEYGGMVGMELGSILVKFFGKPGLIIISLALIAISILLVMNTPISNQIIKLRDKMEARRILRQMEEAEEEKQLEAELALQRELERSAAKSGPFDSDAIIQSELDEYRKLRKIEPEPEKKHRIQIINPLKRSDQEQVSVHEGSVKGDSSESAAGGAVFDPAPPLVLPDEALKKNRLMEFLSGNEFLETPAASDKNGMANTADLTKSKNRSYGLERDPSTPKGFGLDGDTNDRSGKKAFGLDGTVPDNTRKAGSRRKKSTSSGPDGAEKEKTATSHLDEAADLAAAANALNTKELKKANTPTEADAKEVLSEIAESTAKQEERRPYHLPPVDLLKKPKASQLMMSDQQLEQKAELLERTLRNFHVDAKVLTVTQGSSVTRYEVQPAIGVKVSSITKLADDIALNLRAKSIRIEAPIPGKAAVGIEVENEKAAPVLIRELIDSPEFRDAKSKITFVVGKNISGQNIVANLKDMPHLLIAGATGSGKSVCINTIIASILYKAKPDEVKLILIDPKVVELGNYNGIPHMLIPVVTDPKKAAAALNWAVNEMTQRYKRFAEEGVKDLDSFNELMVANQEAEQVMPQVVIIIDELADLMMAAPSQVEECICRLAQMARAAGMHLIVATQRPSVDIVTGVIKANIPSRIAFSVSSQFDSRTILDVNGAEKLLGKGDMLFSPVGSNKPLRVQGPFISDTESSKIISFVKNQSETEYDEEIIRNLEAPDKGGSLSAGDELTDDAIAFILKSKKASVSMLQRRFRIGYNRAASIIDEIEDRGIISPADGSKPRTVLFTEEEYYSAKDMEQGGDSE